MWCICLQLCIVCESEVIVLSLSMLLCVFGVCNSYGVYPGDLTKKD